MAKLSDETRSKLLEMANGLEELTTQKNFDGDDIVYGVVSKVQLKAYANELRIIVEGTGGTPDEFKVNGL